jgi:hypothetical protein
MVRLVYLLAHTFLPTRLHAGASMPEPHFLPIPRLMPTHPTIRCSTIRPFVVHPSDHSWFNHPFNHPIIRGSTIRPFVFNHPIIRGSTIRSFVVQPIIRGSTVTSAHRLRAA